MSANSQYSVFKTFPDGRILVRRHTDGETLIGHPFAIDEDHKLSAAFSSQSGPGLAAAALLNHPNIVSLHTEFITSPVVGQIAAGVDARPKRYLLWDFCDAGTVADLLAKPPCKAGTTGFLPESLVWHVMLDMLRALQWIHEGIRETYTVVDRIDEDGRRLCNKIRTNTLPEAEWMPILHTAVNAKNIFLTQPKGVETYGAAKLGNFAHCSVAAFADTTSHMYELGEQLRYRHENVPLVAFNIGPLGIKDMVELSKEFLWYRHDESTQHAERMVKNLNRRPFYRGSELFNLGTVLFHMMTGTAIPGLDYEFHAKGTNCARCGCSHVTWNGDTFAEEHVPCPHACYPDVNLGTEMDRLTKYSVGLRGVVYRLLMSKWDEVERASLAMDTAWGFYEKWVNGTPDGAVYRDIYDDIWWRKGNETKKKRQAAAVAEELGVEENRVEGDVLIV